LARAKRCQGDRKPRESHDGIDHHVGSAGEVGQIARHLRPRQRRSHLGARHRIGDRDEGRAVHLRLLDQRRRRRPRGKRNHFVRAVRRRDHVKGLDAN
jgi:hypothetical protein